MTMEEVWTPTTTTVATCTTTSLALRHRPIPPRQDPFGDCQPQRVVGMLLAHRLQPCAQPQWPHATTSSHRSSSLLPWSCSTLSPLLSASLKAPTPPRFTASQQGRPHRCQHCHQSRRQHPSRQLKSTRIHRHSCQRRRLLRRQLPRQHPRWHRRPRRRPHRRQSLRQHLCRHLRLRPPTVSATRRQSTIPLTWHTPRRMTSVPPKGATECRHPPPLPSWHQTSLRLGTTCESRAIWPHPCQSCRKPRCQLLSSHRRLHRRLH